MYQFVLFLHSWLRWLILVAFIIVILRSLAGWLRKLPYERYDNVLSIVLVSMFDVQILLGLLLYLVLSPITSAVFMDFGNAMHNPELRFWGVEHIFVMILAAVVIHLGRNFAKKAENNLVKFRVQSIYFLLSLILVLSRIPWGESVRLFRSF